MNNEIKLEALKELPESETGINWDLYTKIKEARKKDEVPAIPGKGAWMKKLEVIKARPEYEKKIRAIFPDEYWVRSSAIQTIIGVADCRLLSCEIHTYINA